VFELIFLKWFFVVEWIGSGGIEAEVVVEYFFVKALDELGVDVFKGVVLDVVFADDFKILKERWIKMEVHLSMCL
jgi:hypothetical protein